MSDLSQVFERVVLSCEREGGRVTFTVNGDCVLLFMADLKIKILSSRRTLNKFTAHLEASTDLAANYILKVRHSAVNDTLDLLGGGAIMDVN